MKGKECIRLRQKKLANGNFSLYLDYYDNGIRRYEFLRLYLLPETSAGIKAANRQTMAIAESVKAQRILSLNSGRHNVTISAGQVLFFPWLAALVNKKGDRGWQGAFSHIRKYESKDISFSHISREWMLGFRAYLDKTTLKPNTRNLYWAKLVCAMHKAYNDGLVADVTRGLPAPPKEKVQRVYLTLPELRTLAETPCHDATKRMFLFSCLTGLRYSDCQAIQWSQVEDSQNGCRLVFRQQKTQMIEYLDISAQARQYMGSRGEGRVFPCIPITSINCRLLKWMERAGINKHISFHCARHTFATLMLSLGTDIFVVSRLLGHTDIKTTQIYAHIIDEQKKAAVDKIPRIE